MKNVIKNQKLFFISLIGIIVISSILIYTYAYQSLQVTYKSGSNEKLTINAGVLDVTFAVSNRLNITSMPLLSSYKGSEYSEFTISNTKSSDDAAYKVSLVDMTYTSNLVSSDFNYTLVNADTNEIISEDNFSSLSGNNIELTDFITLKKNNSVKLRLYLWLKETTSNQNNLENASFKGKIEITSMFDKEAPKNPIRKGTFAYTIINNAKNVTNEQKELGYAVYRETPLTTPAVETTMKYNKTGEEATSERSVSISTTYQGYYWTYGTGYTVDESTGKFTLTGVSTCKYNDGTCHETLVGKYIVSTSASSNSNSSNTQKTTTNLSNIYKVTTAPASSTSTITMKAKEINTTYYSVESTLSTTSDDYGTSYYYRGGVKNNYLSFNNMCWRIVRIEGDGSIKIVLADATAECSTATQSKTDSAFIGTKDYGFNASYMADYEKSQNPIGSMKYEFNEWFTTNLSSVSSKLKKTTACIGDVTTKYDDNGAITTNSLYNYDTFVRLSGKGQTANATLICNAKGAKTSETQIFPLTADEVAFAGGAIYTRSNYHYNYTYYLRDNATSNYWWTLSPSNFDGYCDNAFVVSDGGYLGPNYVNYGDNSLRPTVSLASSAEIMSGDGSISNPYIVE